jgi:hypothetical protein
MPERHPLDEQFRRVLAGAEAEPPPAVWQAVVRARAARGGPAIWPLVTVLLVCGAASALLSAGSMVEPDVTPSPVEDHAQQAGMVPPPTTNPAPGGGAAAIAATQGPVLGMEERPAPGTPGNAGAAGEGAFWSTGQAVRTRPDGADMLPPRPKRSAGNTGEATREALDRTRRNDFLADELDAVVPDRPTSTVLDAGAIGRMDLRWAELSPGVHAAVVHGDRVVGDYVFPAAEWRIGAVTGVHRSLLVWRGADTRVVDALNSNEAERTRPVFGLAVGRHWFSGWGVASGLQVERQASALSYTDVREVVDRRTITHMVTLNAQVYLESVDTVLDVRTDALNSSADRRITTWRIPVEVHWGRIFGRWSLGVRGGVALEYHAVRGGTIAYTEGDGRLVAMDVSRSSTGARHPVAVQGLLGLEAGYRLHERWSLMTSPIWMPSVTTAGGSPEAYAMPRRWGLHAGIVYHLPPCGR